MKQGNDDKTADMLPGGAPVYELDHEMPRPMPAGGKWEPRPEPEITIAQRIAMAFDRVLG